MSLTKRKRRRRLKNPEKNISDVTLNDFANSEKAAKSEVYRKKSGMKELLEEVKSLSLNIEDYTIEEENDPPIPNLPRKRRTKNNECKAGEEITPIAAVSEELLPTNVYPLDVWFIIGEYIRPEDVGRFASICTSSRTVVSSPDFWLRLRRRYVGRTYGGEKNNFALRPLVIRALKQSYEPLLAKPQFFVRSQTVSQRNTIGGNLPRSFNLLRNYPSLERCHAVKVQSTMVQRRALRFLGDHHLVLGANCIQAWQEKRKEVWVYYIKLKHLTGADGVTLNCNTSAGEGSELSIAKDDATPDCWMSIVEESLGTEDEQKKQIGDMWANSEEGCKVIEIVLDKEQVANGHVGPCPQILGLSLVWACARQASTTGGSSNSRHLALLFGPPHLSPRAATSLLSKLSTDWESCGGGWAEPISEVEEMALACGIPTPEGSKCGVVRQRCCRGGRGVSSWAAATHPNGMVPVVIPSVIAIRLLDWWDADYPYPGEVKSGGARGGTCGEEDDHSRWTF